MDGHKLQWRSPPLSYRYFATDRLQSTLNRPLIPVPQMFLVTVFQLELTCTNPKSCEPLAFLNLFHAWGLQRDSRHAIKLKAWTGSPCWANFGSHCGHRFEGSLGTPAGSISTVLGCGSRVGWVWVAGLVWGVCGGCA